jgi:hypothetical protein
MSQSIPDSTTRFAATAAGLAMGLLALAYLVNTPDEDALRQFLVVTGIIAISTALVFGLVIPRALARGGSPGIALTLSLLGLLFVAAYWSGLPPVFAIGGVVLARRSLDGQNAGLGRAAIAIGLLAILADVAALAVDAASSA